MWIPYDFQGFLLWIYAPITLRLTRMAYYRKVRGGVRAEIVRAGHPRTSATWPTKGEAVAWATRIESNMLNAERGVMQG